MYTVNAHIVKNIKREFEEVLEERDYRYTYSAINKIVDTWLERKVNLIELLSHHPQWNPDKLMIHFDTDIERKIDTRGARRFVDWIYRMACVYKSLSSSILNESVFNFMYDYLCSEAYLPNNCWTQSKLDSLKEMDSRFDFSITTKVTRIMGKICKLMGWDKFEERNTFGEVITSYNKEYAKYCDALSPQKIKRHTVISVNPIDYLLMSNGNSWNSCHDIRRDDYDNEPGCYSSGTISYMLDNVSFVFYTVSPEQKNEDIELAPKIQRQMFAYHDYQLYQSRLYPQDNDHGATEIYNQIRAIMQEVMAICLDIPNLWWKTDSTSHVYLGYGATLYPDWKHFNACNVSIYKEAHDNDKILDDIEIGAKPICVECGYTHTNTENINCCHDGKCTICSHCGCVIDDEDDIYWIGDEPYCRDCVFICPICGETYVDNGDNTVWIDSEQQYVCDDCFEYQYGTCERCGETFRMDELNEHHYDWYCDNCLDEVKEEEAEDDDDKSEDDD